MLRVVVFFFFFLQQLLVVASSMCIVVLISHAPPIGIALTLDVWCEIIRKLPWYSSLVNMYIVHAESDRLSGMAWGKMESLFALWLHIGIGKVSLSLNILVLVCGMNVYKVADTFDLGSLFMFLNQQSFLKKNKIKSKWYINQRAIFHHC